MYRNEYGGDRVDFSSSESNTAFDANAQALEALLANPAVVRLLEVVTGTPDGFQTVLPDAATLAVIARWLRVRSKSSPEGTKRPVRKLIKWRLRRAIAYIDEHISEPISLEDLALAAGLSKMYFAAQFRAATGFRPHEYVLRQRIALARELIATTSNSMVVVAGNAGFQTQAHFATIFKRFEGVTPTEWRDMHAESAALWGSQSKSFHAASTRD
ncbi:MAG: AraC family transcriptional regulator [Hyphomicrobium sp.]